MKTIALGKDIELHVGEDVLESDRASILMRMQRVSEDTLQLPLFEVKDVQRRKPPSTHVRCPKCGYRWYSC